MYQVITIYDEKLKKDYYQSYIESEDTSLGNISVDSLPSYQDIVKARSCYWNGKEWVFDDKKYKNFQKEAKEKKEKEDAEKAKEDAKLTNDEIADALMELAELLAIMDERLTALEEVESESEVE